MLEPLRDFQRGIQNLQKEIGTVRSPVVEKIAIRQQARSLVDTYFRELRDRLLAVGIPGPSLLEFDSRMQHLLELTHKRSSPNSYKKAIKSAISELVSFEKIALLRLGPVTKIEFDDIDTRLIETLKRLLPSAAASFEQALLDLQNISRMSWRGPATDLREALRETLDHLAPDENVTSQAGFKAESGTNNPTMKQKVRYILKLRGLSMNAIQASETAVEAVETIIGTFVRSVYTRSNISTHTPTDKNEVSRVRDYVRVALCELLQVR